MTPEQVDACYWSSTAEADPFWAKAAELGALVFMHPGGAENIVREGTDIPFNWPVTVDLVLKAPFLSNVDKEAILGGNLMKLLRIGR